MLLLYPVPVERIRPYIVKPSPASSFYQDFFFEKKKLLDWVKKVCFNQNEKLYDNLYNNPGEFVDNVDLDYFLRTKTRDVLLHDPYLIIHNLKYDDDEELVHHPLACIDFCPDIDAVLFLSTASFVNAVTGKINADLNIQLLLVPQRLKTSLINYMKGTWSEDDKFVSMNLSIVDKHNNFLKKSYEFLKIEIDTLEGRCRYYDHDLPAKFPSPTDDFGFPYAVYNHKKCFHKRVFEPFKKSFLNLIAFAKSCQRFDSLFNMAQKTVLSRLREQQDDNVEKLNCAVEQLEIPSSTKIKIKQSINERDAHHRDYNKIKRYVDREDNFYNYFDRVEKIERARP